jgi:drug/metabolite transporter (DMT)-like permease
MIISEFRGELAALSAAFLWSISSVIYSILGEKIPPLQLNIAKGIIAIAFILITLIVGNSGIPAFNPNSVILLLLSGAIGIGLGDTTYFSALNYLGARLTLLIETLAPPMTTLLALFFLEEKLSIVAWCGILLTILGVAWVITERNSNTAIETNNYKQGILWAILTTIAQSVGAVLSRTAFGVSNISPLWSTLLRLLGGVAIALVILLCSSRNRQSSPSFRMMWTKEAIAVISITAFGSTYLGILLQQISLKYTPAGIAQTLLATSPLFVLPIVAVRNNWVTPRLRDYTQHTGEIDRITLRAILGVFVSILGVAVLFIFN